VIAGILQAPNLQEEFVIRGRDFSRFFSPACIVDYLQESENALTQVVKAWF